MDPWKHPQPLDTFLMVLEDSTVIVKRLYTNNLKVLEKLQGSLKRSTHGSLTPHCEPEDSRLQTFPGHKLHHSVQFLRPVLPLKRSRPSSRDGGSAGTWDTPCGGGHALGSGGCSRTGRKIALRTRGTWWPASPHQWFASHTYTDPSPPPVRPQRSQQFLEDRHMETVSVTLKMNCSCASLQN